jgi:hypothetical protein
MERHEGERSLMLPEKYILPFSEMDTPLRFSASEAIAPMRLIFGQRPPVYRLTARADS